MTVSVICRELAYQISDQFRVFGKQIHLRDETVVGGVGELVIIIIIIINIYYYCLLLL